MTTTPACRLRGLVSVVMGAGGLVVLAALAVAVLAAVGDAWPALMGSTRAWTVLLVLAVPVTTWMCAHGFRLTGFGGAVQVATDCAVVALCLWLGAGSVGWSTTSDTGIGPGVAVGATVLLAWIAGVAVSELVQTHRRAVIQGFNIGLSALAGLALVGTAVASRAVLGSIFVRDATPAGFGIWDVGAALLAGSAYLGVDVVLTALSVAWEEDSRLRDVLIDPSSAGAAIAVIGTVTAGVLAALLGLTEPLALLLLVPVAGALVHASKTGIEADVERLRTRALYAAAEGCQAAPDRAAILALVVEATGTATAAPASVSATAPGTGQIGTRFLDGGTEQWLVAGPRRAQHGFTDDDRTAVATLASLAEQSLARIASVAQVTDLARRDGLTGLLNRRTFEEEAGALLGSPASVPMSVLFCDLDAFKQVNDTFGHGAGDDVLVAVARRLEAEVRPGDVVGRIGGDEFAVLLPAATSDHAQAVRHRLVDAMREPVSTGGRLVQVSVSVGLSTDDGLSVVADDTGRARAEAVLDRADRDMYAQKRSERRSA